MDYECEQISSDIYRISDFGTANCYLVIGTEKAMLIDMGTGLGDLKGFIHTLSSLPLYIVATHGHTDHIGGCGQFEKIYLHPADFEQFKKMSKLRTRRAFLSIQKSAKDLGIRLKDLTKPEFETELIPIENNMIFELGNKTIKIIHTPGHTPGSVILLDEQDKIMFTGDNVNPVLFMFLPGCISLEEWLPNAKIALELAQTYTPFYGHDNGKQSYEQIERIVKIGEKILRERKRNSRLSRIKIDIKFDLKGCIFYRTGNVYKKD